jgi:hypothetical protein
MTAFVWIRFVRLQRSNFSHNRPNDILAGDKAFQALTPLPEPIVLFDRHVLTRKALTHISTSQAQWRRS